MGSESEEAPLEIDDSDDSLLDIKEFNDAEFGIPEVAPPTLESVLWDMESEEEGSDTASMHSLQSTTAKFRSMLCHRILQGISQQVASAGDRVGTGLPTSITTSLRYVAVGTSHGYVLAFDADQSLRWCSHDAAAAEQGAVSALALDLDSRRLLAGHERGLVAVLDARTGDVLRRLADAHAPQSAVLHLRFTFLGDLALCGDSAGCVFSLAFGRRVGVRTCEAKCLFSGARGEVCAFEPLVQGTDFRFLNSCVVVAMVTLSKVIIITIRPRLKVLFSQPLPRAPASLPLLAWQLVSVGRALQPVLAWARHTDLHFARLVVAAGTQRARVQPLRRVALAQPLAALHWLGARHLALLDAGEVLRLVEVRAHRELEQLEMGGAGLVYGSAHFKALAVGGGVSGAFALAGERACYNSVTSRGGQLLVLGTRAVHLVRLRGWAERLVYLSEQGRWAEALGVAAAEGEGREGVAGDLLARYLESLNRNVVDRDSLTAAVLCCVKLNKIDILCNELLEATATDPTNQSWYYALLIDHITAGRLAHLAPSVAQILVAHLDALDSPHLERVLLALDVACLDLHQALTVSRRRRLYDAWIRLTTAAIGDYAAPLTDLLAELTPANHRLGNTLLVYVSSSLAGLAYPAGEIGARDVGRVKADVLRCLETVHSPNATLNEPTYPYLRALLAYNTRECLNVIDLAFSEAEFIGEMGLLQRKRLVQILLQIVVEPEFTHCQIINLACFITNLVVSDSLELERSLFESVIATITTTSSTALSLRDQSEREQAWMELLRNNQLTEQTRDLLQLALSARCYKVVEHLYIVSKDFSNIFVCYLNDPTRKRDIFTYIKTYINERSRCVREQFHSNFKSLLCVDCTETCNIVVEYFANSICELNQLIEHEPELQYGYLASIAGSELKLPSSLAETYLAYVCERETPTAVVAYVASCTCRVEEALAITRAHGVHAASALLLESGGRWGEGLALLLAHGMVAEAVGLCVRGAEHLDGAGSQELWLALLRHEGGGGVAMRQLVHAAAPHVQPEQLLELVSSASFGDVKGLVEGMLVDYQHDVEVLRTTLKLLSMDLHQGLAKALAIKRRGVSVPSVACGICNQQLRFVSNTKSSIVIWSCGHAFHEFCIQLSENDTNCPNCCLKAELYPSKNVTKPKPRTSEGSLKVRPDLEGHY